MRCMFGKTCLALVILVFDELGITAVKEAGSLKNS